MRPGSKGRTALALYTVAVFVFLFAPILVLVIFSFNAAPRTARWEGFTVRWYSTLFHNTLTQQALWSSLTVAGLTTLVTVMIGTPAGIALGRYDFLGKRLTQTLLYLPLLIPEVVLGAGLLTLFGRMGMTLSTWTILVAHTVFCVAYVAIIVRARVAGTDRSLQEAAADLGAPPLSTFFRVTLPLIAPAIVAGALLVFTISLDDYLVTAFVAGVGSTTLPLRIYGMLKTGVTPEVNALSTLLLVFTILLIIPAQLLLRKQPPH